MILRGEKVILRPVRVSDASRYVKWLNDPNIHKYLQVRTRLTLAWEKKWIRQNQGSKTRVPFAIETKDGAHIGNVSLENINRDHNRATFGIFIGNKDYWNRGMGSEAARLILDFGFRSLKLHRIDLGVLVYNPRAIKVYKRLGFKKEGVKRDFIRFQGKYYDEFHMSLLESEWKSKHPRK